MIEAFLLTLTVIAAALGVAFLVHRARRRYLLRKQVQEAMAGLEAELTHLLGGQK